MSEKLVCLISRTIYYGNLSNQCLSPSLNFLKVYPMILAPNSPTTPPVKDFSAMIPTHRSKLSGDPYNLLRFYTISVSPLGNISSNVLKGGNPYAFLASLNKGIP